MLRHTLIVAAAVLAVGGGTATAAKLITGKDVKNSSLTGADIKNKSLGVGELTASARKSLAGKAGPTGATGPAGAAGAKGDAGPKGDKGDTGAKGDAGAKGDQGTQGIQGIQGEQGEQGGQGPAGPSKTYFQRVEVNNAIDSPESNRRVIRTNFLPAGSYEITAKLVVTNLGPTTQPTVCTLGTLIGQEEFLAEIDESSIVIDPVHNTTFTLLGTVKLDAPQRVAVHCEPAGNDYEILVGSRMITAQLTEQILTF